MLPSSSGSPAISEQISKSDHNSNIFLYHIPFPFLTIRHGILIINRLKQLEDILANIDNLEIVTELKRIVPEYISKNSTYEQLDELQENPSYTKITP